MGIRQLLPPPPPVHTHSQLSLPLSPHLCLPCTPTQISVTLCILHKLHWAHGQRNKHYISVFCVLSHSTVDNSGNHWSLLRRDGKKYPKNSGAGKKSYWKILQLESVHTCIKYPRTALLASNGPDFWVSLMWWKLMMWRKCTLNYTL